MKKKSIIFLSVLFLVLSITTMCFATDDVKDMTNSVIDGANDLAEDVRNGIGNAEDTIEGGVTNLAEDVRNGVGDAENFVEDGVSDIGTAMSDDARGTYGVTRTTADMTTTNTTTASVWTWVTIAVAAVVIVALVWYYATQRNNDNH